MCVNHRRADNGGIWGEMKPPGGKFGRKKEEAIAALLTQRNIEEAAKVAGIGANTLLRWLKVPEFQTAYREARRAAFRAGHRAAPAGDLSRGHHTAKAADRPENASVCPRTGGRLDLQPRGQGHRD